jgi:hypothetical protein
MMLRIGSARVFAGAANVARPAAQLSSAPQSGAGSFEQLLGERIGDARDDALERATLAVIAWPVFEARQVERVAQPTEQAVDTRLQSHSGANRRHAVLAARAAEVNGKPVDDVTLHIELEDGMVRISAAAASERVLERLLDSRDDLARALAARGLTLAELSVGKETDAKEHKEPASEQTDDRGVMRSVKGGRGFWEVTI